MSVELKQVRNDIKEAKLLNANVKMRNLLNAISFGQTIGEFAISFTTPFGEIRTI